METPLTQYITPNSPPMSLKEYEKAGGYKAVNTASEHKNRASSFHQMPLFLNYLKLKFITIVQTLALPHERTCLSQRGEGRPDWKV